MFWRPRNEIAVERKVWNKGNHSLSDLGSIKTLEVDFFLFKVIGFQDQSDFTYLMFGDSSFFIQGGEKW